LAGENAASVEGMKAERWLGDEGLGQRVSRRRFLGASLALAAGTGVLLGAPAYITAIGTRLLRVSRVTLPIPRLAAGLEGLRIVQLSDFHLYPYTQRDEIARAVSVANGLQPDIIALTGDFVTQHAPSIDDLSPLLAGLNARLGVFAVPGNHDWWSALPVVRRGLEGVGIEWLRNRSVSLGVNGALVHVAGVDDAWSGVPDLRGALESVSTDAAERGEPIVLLAHEPDPADAYALDGRVSLQLSGHSHGGQVRLPLLGAPVLPMLARRYDRGLYRVRDMWLYTNSGIGVVAPPVRLNCRPEVAEFVLTRAQGAAS